MKQPPIFIIASERSGTNLLRRRLGERIEGAVGPAPLHLLRHLFQAEPYYGDLSGNGPFEAFVADGLGLAYEHFSPWDVEIDAAEVRDRYHELFDGPRCAVGLMHVLYSIYAERKGCLRYICKDNGMQNYALAVLHYLPEAHFVYLHRDPRDVILSQLERPAQVKSALWLARLWRDEQIAALAVFLALRHDGSAVRISYEQLITREAETIALVADRLGLELAGKSRASILGQERLDTTEWKNLDRATLSNNSGKWRAGLSAHQIAVVEATCWQQMERLGYPAAAAARPRVGAMSEVGVLMHQVQRRIALKIWPESVRTGGQWRRARYGQKLKDKWR